jgi:hypothetical protein
LARLGVLKVTMRSFVPPVREDWTAEEEAELDRLREALSADQYEIECSSTDDGDPWCVVHDHAQQDVILHITRLERGYVIVWPREGRSRRTTSLRSAVDMAVNF